MSIGKRCAAEFFGIFWLVFAGLGAAVMAGGTISWLGVSLAVGLTVLTMAYTVGHISGCHLNPAVTLGLAAARRFPISDVIPYIVAQVLGAIAGAGVLYIVASGQVDALGNHVNPLAGGFACNGYAEHSPNHYNMMSCFIAEFVLTMFFLFIIVGTTGKRAPQGFAPIAIGLGLTLIHLVGIPVTNLSVNPARSLGTAVFEGGWALSQVWLFWAAPIAGGIVGGLIFSLLFADPVDAK